MKKIVLAILFTSITLSSCMDRCRVIEYYPPNEIAETYCRNIVPGNYWIYTNQDGTKADSLYFSYVPGEIQGKDIVKNICAGWYQRIMHLHSSYLSDTNIEV